MPLVNFPPGRMTSGIVTIRDTDVPSGVAERDGAFVRRVGGDPARYARDGELLAQATFTTHQIPMSALTEVFGLEASARWRDGTDAAAQVAVQVSLNGGSTFLAWDGAAWSVQAEDETYNPLGTFNDHCHQLTLINPRYLGFRVRLTTANDQSPLLQGLHAYAEWRYDPRMALFEMLRDRLALLRVPLEVIHRMAAAGAALPLDPGYVVDAAAGVQAYNLTTDPLMNTNLFSSWNAGTKTLTLTGPQAQGSHILVRCKGSAPVILVKQDETLKKTQLPITTVHLDSTAPAQSRSTGRQRDWKRGDDRRKVRERQWPTLDEFSLLVQHHASDEAAAVYSIEALREVMSREPLRLPATGELPDLVEVRAGALSDPTGESIYGASWSARIRVHLHQQSYSEFDGAKSIDANVGSARMRWEADSGTTS